VPARKHISMSCLLQVIGDSSDQSAVEAASSAVVIDDSNVVVESAAAVHETGSNFCKSRKRKPDVVEQELLKLLKDDTDDPDRSFFMSLYGDFCKLPTKLRLLQVLCSAAAESGDQQIAITIDHTGETAPGMVVFAEQ